MQTMERVIALQITERGTLLEELEIICRMTGFRLRLLVEHLGDGSCRTIELGPG